MSGTTKAQIFNMALNHIGQKSIQDPDENTSQANSLRRVYTYILREVLRRHNWGFAQVIAVLTESGSYEPLGYSYAYVQPAKCLKMWKIYDEAAAEPTQSEPFKKVFDPSANEVLFTTDVYQAYGEYTYDITDTTKFDDYFVTALTHRLAAAIAFPLNGDTAMAKGQGELYSGMMSDAMLNNYEETFQSHPKNEESKIIDARG